MLDERIKFHFYDNHEMYGSPRIHDKLTKVDKLVVSKKKIANRMKEGLFATPPVKYIHTTKSNHDKRVYDNVLDRNFTHDAPN